jgi:ATP-dependent Zn protease
VKQFGMSEKVGTRSFREEEQDAGLGFVRVNDVSPSMQEIIDLEIKRLMQVKIYFDEINFICVVLFSRNRTIVQKH